MVGFFEVEVLFLPFVEDLLKVLSELLSDKNGSFDVIFVDVVSFAEEFFIGAFFILM